MKREIQRRTSGIFSTGKIIPERSIVGIITLKPVRIVDSFCDLTRLERRSPKARLKKVKTSVTSRIRARDPRIGTPRTKREMTRMIAMMIRETAR